MRKKAIVSFSVTTICILTATLISSCGKTPLTPSSSSISSVVISEGDNQTSSSTSTTSSGIVLKTDNSTSSTPTSSEIISKEKQKEYEGLQKSVDNGHEPGQLNPEEVSMDFALTTLKIANFGKTYDKIEKTITDDHATVIFKKDGKLVMEMKLYQPVKKGAGGIWVVTSWTDGKTNTKHAVE